VADNYEADAGAGGKVFASDQIGAVDWPFIKAAFGPRDTANEVEDADGKRFPVKAVAAPTTTGGLDTYHTVTAGSANAANINASAGQVYAVRVFNVADYPIYVKLHNTVGVPTAGAGVVRVFGVQAGTLFTQDWPAGLAFATGIGITIVKDITDAGTTAVLANDGVVDVDYK
jgi:hypothetical protein